MHTKEIGDLSWILKNLREMRGAIIDHLSYISERKISILSSKKKITNLMKTINTLTLLRHLRDSWRAGLVRPADGLSRFQPSENFLYYILGWLGSC